MRRRRRAVYVGKEPGRPSVPQEEINRLLVEHGSAGPRRGAPEGRRPVRVRPRRRGGRGAGRGGRALRGRSGRDRGRRRARLRRDPGHAPRRGLGGRVRDGARGPGQARRARSTGRRWPRSPARSSSTWACGRCPRWPRRWSSTAARPTEPAAVVERGTLPGQRTVTGPLEQIADAARKRPVSGPRRSRSSARLPRCATGSPGSSARRCSAGGWRSRAPGRRRAAWPARLEELGAEVVEAPAIRIEPRGRRRAGGRSTSCGTGRCDVLCLTSPNGAELLMDGLDRQGLDARVLAGTRVAAIGPGTAAALARLGHRGGPGARARRSRNRLPRSSSRRASRTSVS